MHIHGYADLHCYRDCFLLNDMLFIILVPIELSGGISDFRYRSKEKYLQKELRRVSQWCSEVFMCGMMFGDSFMIFRATSVKCSSRGRVHGWQLKRSCTVHVGTPLRSFWDCRVHLFSFQIVVSTLLLSIFPRTRTTLHETELRL